MVTSETEQILLSRAEVKALGIPGSNTTWLRNEARARAISAPHSPRRHPCVLGPL